MCPPRQQISTDNLVKTHVRIFEEMEGCQRDETPHGGFCKQIGHSVSKDSARKYPALFVEAGMLRKPA